MAKSLAPEDDIGKPYAHFVAKYGADAYLYDEAARREQRSRLEDAAWKNLEQDDDHPPLGMTREQWDRMGD